MEESLPLMKESLEVLKSVPIRSWRREVSDEVLQAEGVRLNLANAMWFTVINMCRLLEFGAFVNFFSLYRDALEMYAYFWYLGEKPSEISMWTKLEGTRKSIVEYGKEDFPKFQRKAVKKFQRKAADQRFLEEAYTLFSTLGTHTNPYSLSMFLTTERHDENLGFCSAGEDENLRCSAHSVLHLIMSLLQDLYIEFGEYMPDDPSELRKFASRAPGGRRIFNYIRADILFSKHTFCLPSRHARLQEEFEVYDSNFEGKWSFW